MAIGVDNRLKQNVYGSRSPLASPASGPRAPQISDGAVAGQQNTVLATSAGAGRMAKQSMDRAGVSRGKGHQYRADYAAGMGEAQAALAAAQVQQDAQMANASARLAAKGEAQADALNSRGLLESLRSGQEAQRTARQGFRQSETEALANANYTLRSVPGLDFSGVLSKLISKRGYNG